MNRDNERQSAIILSVIGIIPVVWLALLIAPSVKGGLPEILPSLLTAFNEPFHIELCEDSLKTVLVLLLCYAMGIGIYFSTQKNYRRREEHGSAKWGNARAVNKKYRQSPASANKLMTQNVCIGLNAKKHRRNLNTLVCGGSGAGKTRFYCKPNLMQCNTSFVILDPKGEILRDTGKLLESKGYEVRVLDLISMEKSHCYNPFVYLQNDNDVQKLVTNLFKSTTPKGSQSQDPFWDTSASMLLLALVFYLHYEAPEDEQNFAMIMEMLRAGAIEDEEDTRPSPLDELFAELEMSNKELQRVNRDVMEVLDNKDIIRVFPRTLSNTNTSLVLKTPKTKTSVRKIFLPSTVAQMLLERKKQIDEMKELFGDEYLDYDLVFCHSSGRPMEGQVINRALKKLIQDNDLPDVVFHSFRHASITYKLKWNGGDMKSVQGDSGHARMDMVADVYSHIIDEDRRYNAQKFEEQFYNAKGLKNAEEGKTAPMPKFETSVELLDPMAEVQKESEVEKEKPAENSTDENAALLTKLLSNPETAALLKALAKTI